MASVFLSSIYHLTQTPLKPVHDPERLRALRWLATDYMLYPTITGNREIAHVLLGILAS